MPWTTLCTLDDLTEGMARCVDIDGFELAVFLQDGQVHVADNKCPHAGGSMSAGHIESGCAVCPWHGWAFDLKTGALRGGLIESEALGVYPARILEENDRKLVQADMPRR